MSRLPIADHALLSDCHSAALVSRAGSVDWLCLPRFDSPALLARLLDDDAGHWSLGPAGEAETERGYLDGTLVLRTVFRTAGGTLELDDALAVGEGERGHDLGRGSPHVLLRRARCTVGEVELRTEFAPRPEYGLVHPLLTAEDGGVRGRGGASVLRLSGAVPWEVEGSVARAARSLRAGEEACFALEHRSPVEEPPPGWSAGEVSARLEDAVRAWRSWSEIHQAYEGPWRERVRLAGRVLQGLTYAPTGAVVAAPTTSLPEWIGGGRNWDYRYAWIRDASLTLQALWVAACPDEAGDFFRFLAGAARVRLEDGEEMPVMFGVAGERELPERELERLAGWRGSRPVRVGNGAWSQRQLDAHGELLDAAFRLSAQLEGLDGETRGFLADVADAAAARWEEPDRGIWEVRGEPRHYLHSKLMCWVALDRAVRMAEWLGAEERAERWARERERVRAAILERGWSERAGAFAQTLGGDALDASSLVVPIVGFLPGGDARVRATIDAVEERLTGRRGLVHRYRSGDGLRGEEGSFLLCTFWLAEALALAGETARAREVWERAAGHANDLGLLSEEVHPETGELLGNFPQAFSHVGLVDAAWAIHRAEGGR